MKLRAVTIDSSVFIAAWNETEKGHAASCRFFETILDDATAIYVPEIAVFEITNVLVRLGLRNRLSSYLQTFRNDGIELVPLSRELFGVFRDVASRISLKTSDLIVCATAALTKSALVSWDRRLVTQASRVLPSASPPYFDA